jgi:RNA polymerase sigma-70 factor, ECF subfamily
MAAAGLQDPKSGFMSRPSEVPPFLSIYRDCFEFVWSSVRRLGVSPAALDDIVQEVFIVVHSRLHTLQQPEALRSWIYGIVRRRVLEYHRTQRVRGALGSTPADEFDMPAPLTPFDLTEKNERIKLLWSLLEELDEPKREVLMMVELDELAVPEVAEILGIPLNTAYSRLRAARQAFEEARTRRKPPHGDGGRPCRV